MNELAERLVKLGSSIIDLSKQVALLQIDEPEEHECWFETARVVGARIENIWIELECECGETLVIKDVASWANAMRHLTLGMLEHIALGGRVDIDSEWGEGFRAAAAAMRRE
jgi:hypothetical protein